MIIAKPVRGQQSPDAAIGPFVDDQTIAVVRIDVGRVDPMGMVDWVAGQLAGRHLEPAAIDVFRNNWKARAERNGVVFTGLRNANATQLYWVLSIADFSGARSLGHFWGTSHDKGIWVVPLGSGADGAAVMRILTAERGQNGRPVFEARKIGNAIVAAAAGHIPAAGGQALGAGWSGALAGDGAIQVAILPGKTLRRVYEENVPNVSAGEGTVPITVFSGGVQWLAISMVQPPGTRLSAVAQANDPASANAANDALKKVLAGMHGEKIEVPMGAFPPLENIDGLVSFKVEGSQLKWTADPKVIDALIVRETEASINVLASSHMKQLLLASIMYANNRKEFPLDIPTVMKDQSLSPEVSKDPLHPQDPVGYVYIKPADWQKDAEKTPVIYQKWEGGKLVGFADGHVEVLESRAAVENLMRSHQPAK